MNISNLKDLNLHGDLIGFDFETDGLDVFVLKPILLGLSTNTNYYIIELSLFTKEEIHNALYPHIHKTWIAHNAKFDWKILYYHYNLYIPYTWCTMVSSQVIYNGIDLRHSYQACVERHFDKKITKTQQKAFVNKEVNIQDEQLDYLYEDLKYLIPLYARQMSLGNNKTIDVWECLNMEAQYLPVMCIMELNGIKLDVDKWKENIDNYKWQEEESLTECKRIIKKLVLKHKAFNLFTKIKQQNELFPIEETISVDNLVDKINLSSSTQVVKMLSKFRVFVPNSSESALEDISRILDGDEKLVIDWILEIRKIRKLISTYGEKFLSKLKDGKIHTEFTQCYTDTGRLSSRKPNMQNIPAKDSIRNCFIAEKGYDIVTIDFSGQELRVAASYSGDPILLKSFNEGLDLHSYLAQGSYRIITGNNDLIVNGTVNKQYRTNHKAVLFGYIYGAGASRIGEVLNINKELALKVYKNLQKALPYLANYQEQKKKEAVRNKKVTDGSRLNRIKYFKWSKNNPEDYKIEKEGCNFPIQATSANMVKEASIKLQNYIFANKLDIKIILQVHDELVFQVPENRLDLSTKLKEIMEEVGTSYLKGLKMESSINIAKHWMK